MNPQRSPTQIVSAIVGFLMLMVSTPCVVAMINDVFIVGTDNTTGALIVGIFMAFVGLGGLAMMFLGLKKPKVAEFKMTQTTERTILSVARHHGGKVTVSELALETQLTLDECQTVLDQLASRDVAQVHVGTAGETVYAFPGLMVDKSSAVDPLDDVAAFDAALGSVALDFETDGDPGRSAEDEQVVASVHHTKHEG